MNKMGTSIPYDDDDGMVNEGERGAIARQIETTAKRQHLTGRRRESFIDSTSLCNSCRWSSSRRRASTNERQMECNVFAGPCPEDITECSEYSTITSLTLSQMAGIAIIIDNGKPKRVGFYGGN